MIKLVLSLENCVSYLRLAFSLLVDSLFTMEPLYKGQVGDR